MIEWSFESLTEELHASDWVGSKGKGLPSRRKGKKGIGERGNGE